VDYVKRVRDLETISNSSAELYLIDNTFEGYNKTVNIAHAKTSSFAGRDFPHDLPLVFISKDAGRESVQTAVNNFDLSISRIIKNVDSKTGADVRCLPLVFCDMTIEIPPNPVLDYVFVTDLPTATKYDPINSPSTNPLLLLASSLLSNTPFKGGEVSKGEVITLGYDEWFGKGLFAGFSEDEATFRRFTHYIEAFKLFWSYHSELAMKFLRNRCRNLELQFTGGYNPFGGAGWQTQKIAFAPAEKLAEKLLGEKTPLTRELFNTVENKAIETTPVPMPEGQRAPRQAGDGAVVRWTWNGIALT